MSLLVGHHAWRNGWLIREQSKTSNITKWEWWHSFQEKTCHSLRNSKLIGMIIVSRSPPLSMISYLMIFFFVSDQMIRVSLGDKGGPIFVVDHIIFYMAQHGFFSDRILPFVPINAWHFTFQCNQIVCCSKTWFNWVWQLTPLATQL